jgi:hypothetical protein
MVAHTDTVFGLLPSGWVTNMTMKETQLNGLRTMKEMQKHRWLLEGQGAPQDYDLFEEGNNIHVGPR